MKEKPRKRYVFVIEISKCIECKACMVACMAENRVPVEYSRNWVYQKGPTGIFPNLGMSFEPGNCMHCENPPCERVCPTRATYKREDGIVLIDPNRCIGCRYCMMACPYNARYFDEKKGVVDKCTFCVHRVMAGLDTACVHTCMTGARHAGDLLDPESEVSRLLATHEHHVRLSAAGSGPAIYYIS